MTVEPKVELGRNNGELVNDRYCETITATYFKNTPRSLENHKQRLGSVSSANDHVLGKLRCVYQEPWKTAVRLELGGVGHGNETTFTRLGLSVVMTGMTLLTAEAAEMSSARRPASNAALLQSRGDATTE
ncbi:uncharacterized protein N7515_008933 [Penicillium bovifimosum]|uniref:Uncharacterized protein n=1 Tax=Penicillium bovifimosum TaxID=126998 RepID=A0A9W9GJP8_9EURO|nr:uncharacterized protein N7515_008933 [Penicillium bovifimosum]KAJ5120972.1 hypothetical protein N7515_008933 [Penicillium bovifimosum]